MEKTVDIALDIKIAKTMLGVAGFYNAAALSDDEVFEKVLSLINCYGATSTIKDNKEEV